MNGYKLVYIRVSTKEQCFDRQLRILGKGGITDNLDGCIFFKDNVSGKNINERSGLQSLFSHSRVGDTVVVASIDRLGRKTLDVLNLIQDIINRGMGLEVMDNQFLSFPPGDELNPVQSMVVTVMAGVAEMERSLILERQREGIAAAKSRGVKFGRKSSGVGADEVLAALEQYKTKSKTADALGLSRSSVYRILKEND